MEVDAPLMFFFFLRPARAAMAGLSASVESDTDVKALDVATDISSGPDTSDGGVAVAGHLAEAEDIIPNHIYGSRKVTLGTIRCCCCGRFLSGLGAWPVGSNGGCGYCRGSGASHVNLYH